MTKQAETQREDGETVKAIVGRTLCFKSDLEQCAIVKEIREGGWDGSRLQVRVDVSEGEYAGDEQWLDLATCWN